MANISKLSTVVTANASQYDTVMERVRKRYEKLQEQFNKSGGKSGGSFADMLNKDRVFGTGKGSKGVGQSFSKSFFGGKSGVEGLLQGATKLKGVWVALLAVLAALGVGLAVRYILKVTDAALETYKFSKTVGDTAQNLMALQHAFRSVNVDATLVNSTIEDLGKTLNAGLSGDIAINDIFSRLKLNVKELSNMKPTEAFSVIADAIAKIPDPIQRGAIAYQIFGDKAKDILPAIMLGKDGLAKAADEAKRLGMNLSQTQLAKLEQGKIAAERLEQVFQGLALQVALEAAPAIITLVRLLENINGSAGSLGGVFSGLLDVFVTLSVGIYNTILTTRVALLAFKMGIEGIILGITFFIQEGLGMVAVAVSMIAPKVGKALMRVAKDIVRMRKNLMDQVADQSDTADSLWGDIINEDDFKAKMQKVQQEFRKEWEKTKQIPKAQASANFGSSLYDEAKSIIKDTATPLEKYQSELTKLDRMLETGAISWDTYGRAVAKATNELEQALQTQSVQLPTVARRDTAESVTAFNKARLENDLKNKETPQQRIERLQREALTVQQRIEEHTKRMADAATKRNIVQIK